jgi:enoyl-CoA hydratase/carnithine racemase
VAMELAHEIADITSSVSTSLSRRLLWQMKTASHPMQSHQIETHVLNVRGVSADVREGISAFSTCACRNSIR